MGHHQAHIFGTQMLIIDRNGIAIHSLIKPAIAPTIERGEMKEIHGIIVHQTGGSTAQSSIDSYKNPSANGAHFLIEKDGTIYQNRFPLQTNMAHWQNKSALFTGKAMHTS